MTQFPADNNLNNTDNVILVQEGPSTCGNCQDTLCLREKIINLALGHTEIMYCLICLGKRESKEPEEILSKVKKYIMARECFHKEWIKYDDISLCGKPKTCLIHRF